MHSIRPVSEISFGWCIKFHLKCSSGLIEISISRNERSKNWFPYGIRCTWGRVTLGWEDLRVLKYNIYNKIVCVRAVVSDSESPWTEVRQAPLSLGFSKQGYWSGLSFPTPRDVVWGLEMLKNQFHFHLHAFQRHLWWWPWSHLHQDCVEWIKLQWFSSLAKEREVFVTF